MPKFTYVDPETREYNAYGLVQAGKTVEADVAPDERWVMSETDNGEQLTINMPPGLLGASTKEV